MITEWTTLLTCSSCLGQSSFLSHIIILSAVYPHNNNHIFSISFILYTHTLFLINLYATSGRNAPDTTANAKDIELETPRGNGRWYSRTAHVERRRDLNGEPTSASALMQAHITGEDDDE